MRQRMTRLSRVIAVLAVISLVAAACSSSETTTTAAADTTAPPDSSGVTIGVLAALTGELGMFGTIVADAFKLGIDEVNATGLNPCGPIQAQFADTETSAEVAIRQADRLIGSSDNLVGFFGLTSESMVALIDTAHENQLMLTSPYAGSTQLNELGGDFVYRFVGSDLDDGAAAAAWILDNDWPAVGVIVEVSESPLSAATVVEDIVNASDSATVVGSVDVISGQTSYQAELTEVLSTNPDVIYMSTGLEAGVTILREASDFGYNGNWMLSADLVGPDTIEQAGPDIVEEVVYAEGAEADRDLPTFQRFAGIYEDAFGEEPLIFSPNAYDAAITFGLAMSAGGGSCTGAAINDNFRAVTAPPGVKVTSYEEGAKLLAEGKDIDYEGASGPLTFDESGTPPASFAIFQVIDGTFEVVNFYPASFFEG